MSATAEPPGAFFNYFTCTLGEDVERFHKLDDIQTVNDFIDHQSRIHTKNLAVGIPTPRNEFHDWGYETFNFEELRNGSIGVAAEIIKNFSPNTASGEPECVALLCPSSVDFLFAWLGLIRAGYAVLLIAPQCQPAAIAHLCKSCDVSILFHDVSFADLASRAISEPGSEILAKHFPWQAQGTLVSSFARASQKAPEDFAGRTRNAHQAAFIFHTSGTSTGLPKPIVQSHHAAFGVLPILHGRARATFTTTPLYHGGIADCFRAWASGALIWLFPAATVPITAMNMKSCFSAAAKATSELKAAPVKFFSSVPYILQMLSEDASGLTMLQNMDIVGVGGAALSPAVGDGLVVGGVNLVSRFGSAECGFLLSSHRNYEIDKDWQYLRLSPESSFLSFESQENSPGLFELVVKKGWPHMAKSNRQDGSFATSDLFEPHPNTRGAWRYHGRSDSQITLITGKKFDPAPVEDLITSSSPLIREVVIFGSGKLQPGIVVFCSENACGFTEKALEEKIWATLQSVNSNGQDHTRIQRDMLIIKSPEEPPLERSSKGTLLRGAAEKRIAICIEGSYASDSRATIETVKEATEADDIKGFVRSTVFGVLEAGEISDDADFFAHGVDSTMCTKIRSLLQKYLIQGKSQLPFNVVYDCGSIDKLTLFITDLLNGEGNPQEDEEAEMTDLVKRFSNLDSEVHANDQSPPTTQGPSIVILTGATGALGANILDILRNDPSVSQVICLVRAVDHFTARSRVSASLVKRKKPPLEVSDEKVWCSPCMFSDKTGKLGISEMELSHIRQNATHIIHAAWVVNFSLSLKSFVDEHVHGLYNLFNLTLSCSHAVEFTFCSSTASILAQNNPSNIIGEEISSNPHDSGAIGYSKSKWVAEAICAAAARQLSGPVNVLRLGQLTGDTVHGVWNISEAWPLLLSTVNVLQCLPQLEEPLSWLPLDTAAKAVVDIALQSGGENEERATCKVYHLVNNSTQTTWSDLLAWSKANRPTSFEVVPPRIWLDKLQQHPIKHPAMNLLGLWESAYGNNDIGKHREKSTRTTIFSVEKSEKKSVAMRSVVPFNQELMDKIWSWLDDEIKAVKTQVYVSKNRFNIQ